MYGGVEVWLHSFFTCALDDEWSPSRPSHFIPGDIDFSGQTEYGTAWASKQQNMYTEMQFVKIRVIFRYAELI